MLSGDFGETFKVDDDFEYDDDDLYAVGSYQHDDDEYESDDDDEDEYDDDDEYDSSYDEDDSFAFTPFIPALPPVTDDNESQPDGLTDQVDDNADEEVAGSTDDNGAEPVTELSSDENAGDSADLIESALQSDSAEAVSAVSGHRETDRPIRTGNSSAKLVASGEIAAQPVDQNTPDAGENGRLEAQRDERTDPDNESSLGQQAAVLPTIGPPTAGSSPPPLEPAMAESMQSSPIAWLGSFADDLSVVDEALSEFLRDSTVVVTQSVDAILQPQPLVTAGVAAAGMAARAAYRRRRTKSSLLDCDFCAVGFDSRLYPEIFG